MVSTVAIGHGIVIPQSFVGGINELALGFSATVVGASVAYLLGLRSVLPELRPPT
jgi:hypothetical protein